MALATLIVPPRAQRLRSFVAVGVLFGTLSGCRADGAVAGAERTPDAPRQPSAVVAADPPTVGSATSPTATTATTTSAAAPSNSAVVAAVATASSSATAAEGDDASPEALVEEGLAGTSYNYRYDGSDIKRRDLAWYGRAYLSPKTAAAKGALPLVIFLHGLNAAQIKYRWMGGGKEGDVRRIVGDLIERGDVQPAVVAGPSSVVKSQVARGSSWRELDLDHFIDVTIAQLAGIAEIDQTRIVVAGHSGAGCSKDGGILRAVSGRRRAHAILSLDTCMIPAHASRLAQAAPQTHIVVGYQRMSWQKRDIRGFLRAFDQHLKESSTVDGVYRVIEKFEPKRAPHDQVVPLALSRWLPKLLPPSPTR